MDPVHVFHFSNNDTLSYTQPEPKVLTTEFCRATSKHMILIFISHFLLFCLYTCLDFPEIYLTAQGVEFSTIHQKN